MGKRLYNCLFVVVFLLIMSISFKTYATSWAVMEPQEVVERADVIVLGTYDFSSKPQSGEFQFDGYQFHVEEVYKGVQTKQIIVGINLFDVGWATELQNKGGKFLLFLEKSEGWDFLVPVGGPNGMVQVVDGKVQEPRDERRIFFGEFLTEVVEQPIAEKSETLRSEMNIPVIISAGAIIGIAVSIIVYRYKRKK